MDNENHNNKKSLLNTLVNIGYQTKFKIGDRVIIKDAPDILGSVERIQISPSEGADISVIYCVTWFTDGVKNESWFYGFQLQKIE